MALGEPVPERWNQFGFTGARDSEWQRCPLRHMQICTLPRQIIMPSPNHSVFYRLYAIPAAQPTASNHWRQLLISCWTLYQKELLQIILTAKYQWSGCCMCWVVADCCLSQHTNHMNGHQHLDAMKDVCAYMITDCFQLIDYHCH